ncbi:MAG: hypothetical protein KDA99_03615 [Planctomycetales bacterium]|nr:hypothetical protein [Planctomycetales bacterium]
MFARCEFTPVDLFQPLRDANLSAIVFWDCTPNNATLDGVRQIKNLRKLAFRNGNVDRTAVEALKRSRPEWEIVISNRQGTEKLEE